MGGETMTKRERERERRERQGKAFVHFDAFFTSAFAVESRTAVYPMLVRLCACMREPETRRNSAGARARFISQTR